MICLPASNAGRLLGVILPIVWLSVVMGLAHPNLRTYTDPFNIRVQAVHKGVGVSRCSVDLAINGRVVLSARTDDDGWVEFSELTSERFELVVRRTGYFPRRVVYYDFSRQDIVDAVSLKRRTRWTLSGTVRERDQLRAGVKVRLVTGGDSEEESTTDARGVFSFSHLYDTEGGLVVESIGSAPQRVWLSNREQVDVHVDVECSSTPWRRGEEESAVRLTLSRGTSEKSYVADRSLVILSYLKRVEPGSDRPVGAITGARLLCPYGAIPAGALARVDRLLSSWTCSYPRRYTLDPSLPLDPGRARRGRITKQNAGP